MKREDILKIADRYGLLRQSNMHEDLLYFAADITEAEREECAKVCEDAGTDMGGAFERICDVCADAIRERRNG